MVSGDKVSSPIKLTTGKAYRRLPHFLSRKTPVDIIFDVCNYLFLVVFSFTIFYPFWSTLLLSFAGTEGATSLGFRFWISDWTLHSYKFSFSRYGKVNVAYMNSILRTVIGTFLTISFTIAAAYPLSKRDLPFRNVLTIFILITMFFSGGLIPTYLLIKKLHLYDTRLALILPNLVIGFYVIITRNFLMTIDKSFEESAFMDGANYLQILIRIIIPLSKPVIATIALWTAVFHWNSWFDALIYIKSESKIVLQVLLRRLVEEMTVFGIGGSMDVYMIKENIALPSESVKAAIIIMTIGPIIFMYPFLQKYFIKGIFLGSLKG